MISRKYRARFLIIRRAMRGRGRLIVDAEKPRARTIPPDFGASTAAYAASVEMAGAEALPICYRLRASDGPLYLPLRQCSPTGGGKRYAGAMLQPALCLCSPMPAYMHVMSAQAYLTLARVFYLPQRTGHAPRR